ncbi:MAG: hypothetical protein PVSMB4_19860 [Ktedonobacterales bacterium]
MSHDVVGVVKFWDMVALEAAARHEHDARVCRRILAMLHLARGYSVAQTAGQYALGQSVLYGWIRRYDAEGLEGLRDRPRSGQPPHLAREHEAAFLQRLHAGPSPKSGLAAWRGEDLERVAARGVWRRLLARRGVRAAAPAGPVEPGAATAPSAVRPRRAGGF